MIELHGAPLASAVVNLALRTGLTAGPSVTARRARPPARPAHPRALE